MRAIPFHRQLDVIDPPRQTSRSFANDRTRRDESVARRQRGAHNHLDDLMRQTQRIDHLGDELLFQRFGEHHEAAFALRLVLGLEPGDVVLKGAGDFEVAILRARHRLDDIAGVVRMIVAEEADVTALVGVGGEEADFVFSRGDQPPRSVAGVGTLAPVVRRLAFRGRSTDPGHDLVGAIELSLVVQFEGPRMLAIVGCVGPGSSGDHHGTGGQRHEFSRRAPAAILLLLIFAAQLGHRAVLIGDALHRIQALGKANPLFKRLDHFLMG